MAAVRKAEKAPPLRSKGGHVGAYNKDRKFGDVDYWKDVKRRSIVHDMGVGRRKFVYIGLGAHVRCGSLLIILLSISPVKNRDQRNVKLPYERHEGLFDVFLCSAGLEEWNVKSRSPRFSPNGIGRRGGAPSAAITFAFAP